MTTLVPSSSVVAESTPPTSICIWAPVKSVESIVMVPPVAASSKWSKPVNVPNVLSVPPTPVSCSRLFAPVAVEPPLRMAPMSRSSVLPAVLKKTPVAPLTDDVGYRTTVPLLLMKMPSVTPMMLMPFSTVTVEPAAAPTTLRPIPPPTLVWIVPDPDRSTPVAVPPRMSSPSAVTPPTVLSMLRRLVDVDVPPLMMTPSLATPPPALGSVPLVLIEPDVIAASSA